MRVVTNEAHVARNRKISHALFFISLAGMVGGFLYSINSDATTANQISCFILPILLLLTLTSVRMANNWIREPRPETVLAETFKGMGNKYTLFHYLLPAPHVLIGPEGVFTLTTLWHEKRYSVSGRKWHGDGGLLQRLLGYMRQDLLGNPFQEAEFQAQQVQRLVDKIAPDSDIDVQPLVVFFSPKVEVDIEDPVIPVLFADAKRKPNLRQYLREQKGAGHRTLSPGEMDKLDKMYGLLTRQEIAELEGRDIVEDEDLGDELDAAGAEMDAEEAQPSVQSVAGTLYVLRTGQLCHIDWTDGSVEDAAAAFADESGEEVEIFHTIESSNPGKLKQRLYSKFDRKRQKGIWFGLSKKDLAWLQSLEGDEF